MSTLTFSPATFDITTVMAPDAAKPGFGRRFLDALIASRQRQAEIEIRRTQALMGDKHIKLDYAMLPFGSE